MGRFSFAAAAAVLTLASCGGCSLSFGPENDGPEITLVTYNVRNLFDDAAAGTEYEEFDPSKGKWTSQDYERKLERIGKVVLSAAEGGADVVAFMEIENEKVLKDLNSRWLKKAGYKNAVVAPELSSPIRVGVLSRFPVLGVRSHEPAGAGFHQRKILELELSCEGRPLTVFICHFKAKSEGAEATEKARLLAARFIRKRTGEILAADPSRDLVVLGDLNENVDEYDRTSRRYTTALLPAGTPTEANPSGIAGAAESCLFVTGDRESMTAAAPGGGLFYSPWLDDPPHPGSYWYRTGWETIDHFLLAPGLFDSAGLSYAGFEVLKPSFALNAEGKPSADYSDHLPLLLRLKAEKR